MKYLSFWTKVMSLNNFQIYPFSFNCSNFIFLCISQVFHSAYVSYFYYPCISWWTSSLFQIPDYSQEHQWIHISYQASLQQNFVKYFCYMPKSGIAGSYGWSIFSSEESKIKRTHKEEKEKWCQELGIT